MKMLLHLAVIGGWLLALGTLAGFGLRWWAGDHFAVARFVNYLMPWLLIPLAGLLIVAVAQRHRVLSLLLAGGALAVAVTYAPLFLPAWPHHAPPPANGTSIKVMSYNVWSKNTRVEAMARVIGDNAPDLLLLQEIRPRQFAALRDRLAALSPEHLHSTYDRHLLQGVISRYPVSPLKSLKQLGQAQKVAIQTPFGDITVFNVHPLRRGGWQRRHRQIAALLEEEICGSAGPVILAGDFNTTDQTQLYRMLVRQLQDAHWEAGVGFGFTYPAAPFKGWPLPPIVRIDHIFYNRHFQAVAAATLDDSGGSDHFPVVAELAFLPTPK